MFTKPSLTFQEPHCFRHWLHAAKKEKYIMNLTFVFESSVMVSLLKKNKHMKNAVLFYTLEAKI